MPLVDLICLANSNKMGGRCIAGLRTDGGGWVRPIASETEHGQLYFRHFKLDDGSEPKVLDVIRVDLARAAPAPGQPYPTSTICAKPGDASATHLVGIGQTNE